MDASLDTIRGRPHEGEFAEKQQPELVRFLEQRRVEGLERGALGRRFARYVPVRDRGDFGDDWNIRIAIGRIE